MDFQYQARLKYFASNGCRTERNLKRLKVYAFEMRSLNKLRSCCFLSFVSSCVPAGGSVPWDYLTQASIQAVVWLHGAGALTRQAVHRAVARITQTLGLVGPTVHHAAWKLIAGQELTGVCLVSWSQQRGEGRGKVGERSSRREERCGRNRPERRYLININAVFACLSLSTDSEEKLKGILIDVNEGVCFQ